MLIVLYVRNKNIEKKFLNLEWGFWGHARSRSQGHDKRKIFLFVYIHLRYEYHWKAAEKTFSMILASLKSNKK